MAAFKDDRYRNVLAEAGYDRQEIENRLNEWFNTMFYGADDERVYYPVGDDTMYVPRA